MFLFITISFKWYTNVPPQQELLVLSITTQDSLVISKNNGKRTCVVKKERKIKIWVGKKADTGEFLGLDNDSLILKYNGSNKKYNVNDIVKIKIFENLGRRLVGGGAKIIGI